MINKLFLALAGAILLAHSASAQQAARPVPAAPQLSASSYVLVDFDSDRQFSADNKSILIGDRDGVAKLWDLETGLSIIEPVVLSRPVTQVGINPQMSRLFVNTQDEAPTVHRPLPPVNGTAKSMILQDWVDEVALVAQPSKASRFLSDNFIEISSNNDFLLLVLTFFHELDKCICVILTKLVRVLFICCL